MKNNTYKMPLYRLDLDCLPSKILRDNKILVGQEKKYYSKKNLQIFCMIFFLKFLYCQILCLIISCYIYIYKFMLDSCLIFYNLMST
jgi:hypothetical protein